MGPSIQQKEDAVYPEFLPYAKNSGYNYCRESRRLSHAFHSFIEVFKKQMLILDLSAARSIAMLENP